MDTILPVLLFVVIAAAVSASLLILPLIVAPRRKSAVKEMPYESGMDPVHDTRRRFDVRFHLVAVTFLVFDVELVLIFPFILSLASSQIFFVFILLFTFLAILILGLAHELNQGRLN